MEKYHMEAYLLGKHISLNNPYFVDYLSINMVVLQLPAASLSDGIPNRWSFSDQLHISLDSENQVWNLHIYKILKHQSQHLQIIYLQK